MKRVLASFVVAAAVAGWAAPAAAQAPVRVGGAVREPRKIKDVKPVYPEVAQQAHVQGLVILEIVIGADGSVQDAKVLRPAPMLEQAALDAVTQWKYAPTLLNGVPVPVVMAVTISFNLLEPPSASVREPATEPPVAPTTEPDVAALLDYAKVVHAKGLLDETEHAVLRALQAIQQEKMKASAAPAPVRESAPVRVGAGSPKNIPAPAILSSTAPANLVGITIVEVTIDAAGHVTDAKILRPGGASDQAVIDAVKQWRFAPTLVDGVAVPVITTITVR